MSMKDLPATRTVCHQASQWELPKVNRDGDEVLPWAAFSLAIAHSQSHLPQNLNFTPAFPRIAIARV
jgi:hypothetical protein